MADELNDIEEAPPMDAPPDGGGPGDLVLKPEDQKKLDLIVSRMKAAKEKPEDINSMVTYFTKKYASGTPSASGMKPQSPKEFLQQNQAAPSPSETETTPTTQIKNQRGMNESTDPLIAAHRQYYTNLQSDAVKEVESPQWKDKIFTGKVPALTEDSNMPIEAFQKIDPKAVDQYIQTKNLQPNDKYWLRNQLLNYGSQRLAKYYIDQRAQKVTDEIPAVKDAKESAAQAVKDGRLKPEDYEATWQAEVASHPEVKDAVLNAYSHASQQFQAHQAEAVANRLNNVGLTDKPLNQNIPFHDQITGLHKALMGTINSVGDLGQQVSSLYEMSGDPVDKATGYHLKTMSDDLKASNAIPQNGEAGNVLAGEALPMALNMIALQEFAGAAGAPIYRSLAGARASGAIGKFTEGMLGGLAVSPGNSFLMAHQYYNDLIKQGVTPDVAGSKSDQLFTKNLTTDMLMTPLQMGLLKLPTGNAFKKLLTMTAEGATSGLHFGLQDFNQQSTDNPAMHIIDYAHSDQGKKTMIMGAVLGTLMKAGVDAKRSWEVDKETNKLFSYNRQHLNGETDQLPANKSIANNILSAIEMKNTPGRVQELKDLTNSLAESGTYTPGEATRINSIIDDVAAVKQQVPQYGTPHQKLAVFNQLLENHSRQIYAGRSGESGAAKLPEQYIKEGQERIQRIMAGQEPLYFINGNETNRDQLLDVLEKNPEMLGAKGVNIKVINDSPTQNKIVDIKTKHDELQKQSGAAGTVRDQPDHGQAGVRPAEKEGGKDSSLSPGNAEMEGSKQDSDKLLVARHADTEHDEQKKVSGQNMVGLSDQGITDAHDLKEEVHAHHNISKIVSSDLTRARETADIVADGKIPTETRKDLRSWDLKDFSGMGDDEFKKVQRWFVEHPDETKYAGDLPAHQGKEVGESFNDYAHRVIKGRQDVENEGAGTMLIAHSNNMNIWDAYQRNGGKWDEKSAQDYLSSPTPEPATIQTRPEDVAAEGKVNEGVASGAISDDQLKHTAKLYIDAETQHEPGSVQPHDQPEAGDNEDDGTPRQYSKIPGPSEHVPALGEGDETDEPDKGSKPLPGDTSPPDSVKLTKSAKQLIAAGRTDDQVLAYLQRKGMSPGDALAALGEAKTNPLDDTVKNASIEKVKKEYWGKEGDWLGRKDLEKVNSQQEARAFQDRIKASVKEDKSQKGTDWKDVDRAIHIYLDTKRNPEHLKEYYDKLTPAQKKIVDLSQNLNARQLAIADEIDKQYQDMGWHARNEGLIKEALDNYVARAWDLKSGKPATEENFKFATSSRHQLQRTLDTILQGYAEGMKLKIEGATNNLQVLKTELNNVFENKRLIEQGLQLKYNSGELNKDGKPILKPLFTTHASEPGYVAIKNPAFKKWEYAGKVADHPEQDAEAYGRRKDVLIAEDGTIMKKEQLYAPKDVATSLNNILGHSAMSDIKTIQAITKFNAAVKQSILSYSGFHFIAFTRAHFLATKLSGAEAYSPRAAYKAGLNMLAEQHPIGQRLIKEGMTVNRQQDFTEAVNAHNTWLGKQLDKVGFLGAAKDKMIGLNTQFHKYLFNTYGAGLKMFDGVNMIKAEMARKPPANAAEVKALYQRVGKLMNDTYGGINWDRMHGTQMQNPTVRHLTSLALLAPDWTASNLRFAKKAFALGDEAGLYRRTWARVILRGAMLTAAANSIMAIWDDKDDEGNPLSWSDAMARRAGKAWDAGRLRSFMVDITPVYHAIGGDPGKRAYFSIFGAYTDPIKMIATPLDFLESKTSFITKSTLEAMTSQNWQHKEFTTLDELTGLDDKGTYTKTQTAHEKGAINPSTGDPYKRSQKGYEEGDQKGGKNAGEFTKWPRGGAHPVQLGRVSKGFSDSQLPSFIGSQMRGMMPTAIQSLWQIASGENDVTTGLLNAAGSGVYTSKEPKP